MNYSDYDYVIQQAQFGYAYHEIILDSNGQPIDYRFLESNLAFEILTGLKSDRIKGKTVREILPGIEKSKFDWIAYYGNIALHGGTGTFEQYSEQLGRWYNVKVYSPEKNHFTTVFVDVTNQHMLTEASGQLNQYTCKNVDYQYIVDKMIVFSGARYAVLNKWDPDGTEFSTVAVSGLKKNIEKAAMMLGFQITRKHWKLDPVRESKIRNSKTTFFGHLQELTGDVLPRDIINALAEITGIGNAAVVKTVQEGRMVGDFTLIFNKGHIMTNQWLVESFADMVGMLLGRINAEEEMLAQKEVLEDFFNVNLDLLCIADTAGNFIKVNKEWEAILGYATDELQKRNFLDFVHPDDMHTTLESMARLSEQQPVLNFVNRYQCKDGNYRFIEWRSHPHGSLIYAAARDITDRKRAEEELIKKNSFIQTVLDNLPIGVAINEIDKGNAFYLNKKFEEIYGWPASEMTDISSFFQKVYPDEHFRMELMARVMNDIQSGDANRMHWENIPVTAKDGTNRIVNATNIPLFDQNIMVSTVSDVTEQKLAENELLAAKEKAEESDRLKSAFLANMSHEIRTPMNGILGFTELLKEPVLTGEEQQNYISVIEKSGNRLLNIINDIISLSKIESGQEELSFSETNINEQIDYMYNFFSLEASGKGINLKIKAPLKAKKAIINTDKEKIYAVLTNLIKNALKFTQSGSIEFGYEVKEHHLEFFVKDTGSGIPSEQQAIIFERFRQGTTSLTRNYEGAGLGLSISKGFVEMLGGRIWVESEHGKGSVFYFTIPHNGLSEDKSPNITLTPAEVPDKNITSLKILVAEDDEPSELYLKIALSRVSKEILFARTGIEAVDMCRNNPDIDIVFMDIQMPGLNGYEAAKQIREFNPAVIIIAQTAFALNDDPGKAIASGCSDFLAKPVSKGQLHEIIEKYFSGSNPN